MAENNLVEATAVRKRQVIGEITKNTEFCCLVWKETGQPGQYTASTRGNVILIGDKEFTFYISRLKSGIFLDVLTNCRRFVTYDSDKFPDVTTLYQTIEGIAERRVENITEAIQNLQSVPPQCGLFLTEYTRGGVVVGGNAEEDWVNKKTDGGIVIGGHAPYNQKAETSGGAILSGEARVNPIIEVPVGGIVVGGTTNADQRIEVGGGITIGGSVLFETYIDGSGGAVTGGTIPESGAEVNIIGSGGIVIGTSYDIWYSFADNTSGTILNTISYDGQISNVYNYDSTYELDRLAIDYQNKRVFYVDTAKDIHKSSQFDSSNDVIIGSIVNGYYANIDYDNGYLAYQDGPHVMIIDDQGNNISNFAYPGSISALAVDGTNEHVYLSLNLGSGFGGYRIRKYDLTTFTQLYDHPVNTLVSTPPRLALSRKSGLLFFGYAGGTEQASLRIYKIDTDFVSQTTLLFGFQGRTYDFDSNDVKNELVIWLRDTSEVLGTRDRIIKMDYDGSNQTTITGTGDPTFTQKLWIEANPIEFAEVSLIKGIEYGGVVCAGEAAVSLTLNP